MSNLSPLGAFSCSDSLLQQQIDNFSRQIKDMSIKMLEMEEQLHLLISHVLRPGTLGSGQQEGTLPSLQTTTDDANTAVLQFQILRSGNHH